MNMNNLFFKTPCTQLSSAIVTNGTSVSLLKKDEDGRCFFFFKKNEQLDRIISDYYAKNLPTDAFSLFENKILKQRIANLKA